MMRAAAFYLTAIPGTWLCILGVVAPGASVLTPIGFGLCLVAAAIVGSTDDA